MSDLKVWSRFSITKSDGSVLKLRIQDVPRDRIEDVVDFNLKYFVPNETFHKAAGINNSKAAMLECRGFVTELMNDPSQHITVCCLDESDVVGDIIAISAMSLMVKEDDDDFDLKLETAETRKFFELLDGLYSHYDVMDKCGLERYYDGRGVVVHPEYKRLGIATQLLNVRRSITKAHDISMTGAWMTAVGSQKAAERAGWETIFEISYEDLGRQYNVVFSDVPPTCKLMVVKI